MVISKSVPSAQKLLGGCDQECGHETPFATPIATPSKHAQGCYAESPAPKQHYKTQATASDSLKRWAMHCLDAPQCLQAALPLPCSPSESEKSLSVFSTNGSSSSSSSFFNDTCSSGVGELSPSSVGSREAKSTLVSPNRLSFQEMQVSSKLHPFGYNTIAHTTPQKPGGWLHDGLPEYSFEKGRVSEGHGYPNCKSTCTSSLHWHVYAGEYEGRDTRQRARIGGEHNATTQEPCVRPESSSLSIVHNPYCMVEGEAVIPSKEPAVATCPSDGSMVKTVLYSKPPSCSHEFKQVISPGYQSKGGIRCHADVQMTGNNPTLIHNHDLLQQLSKDTEGLSRISDTNGKCPNIFVDSCIGGVHDTHEYLKCVLEHGSSPYDTEIGIDVASLGHLPDLMTPCKEVSLSRALSLHQSPYTYGRPPLIPIAKLNNTPCTPGGRSSKELLQRRRFTGVGFDANGNLAQWSKRWQVQEHANASPLNTRAFRKSSSTIFSNEDTIKIEDGSCVQPATTHNSYIEQSLVSSFLPMAKKNAEKGSALHSEAGHDWESTTEMPTSFSSKAHRDWRSRSLGERASLKSTARNLEAAFSGYRSASVCQPSSCIAKGVSKSAAQLDNSKSMDKVFVSSVDSHRDHPYILKSSNMSLDRKGQCSEDMVLCSEPLRRKAMASSTEMHTNVCAPKKLVIKPLAPIAHKQRRPKFELLCKPLLPVAHSIYQLPSSKGALYSKNPWLSGHSLQGLSSDASKVTSLSMLEAYVQCTSTDGVICYTMTMEGVDKMLMAKDCRPETPSSTTGPKWLYRFYSGKAGGKGPRAGGWRRWTRRENKAPLDLIGIMQVSSVCKPDALLVGPEGDYMLALDFVLYDGKAYAATHSQSLRICPKDMPSHKRYVLGFSTEGMWSSSHCAVPSRHSHVEAACTSLSMAKGASSINGSVVAQATTSPLKGYARHRPTYSLDGWSDSDLTDSDSHVHDPSLLSHMELAAIVMRVPMKGHQSTLNVMDDVDAMGGWGLKFLTESDIGSRVLHRVNKETSKESSTSVCQAEAESAHWPCAEHKSLFESGSSYGRSHEVESMGVMENGKSGYLDKEVYPGHVNQNNVHHEKAGSSKCLTLILPLGDHSLPSAEANRPSSLIERWQSGGSCECGGWDVGCGIEVLSTGKSSATSHTSATSELSDDQPISMFSQGTRKELLFSLSAVKQGKYKLKFQEKLSTLRAFATAVAILHGHKTALISPSPSPSPSSTSTSTPSSTSLATSSSLS